jgi:hypothetical protein
MESVIAANIQIKTGIMERILILGKLNSNNSPTKSVIGAKIISTILKFRTKMGIVKKISGKIGESLLYIFLYNFLLRAKWY